MVPKILVVDDVPANLVVMRRILNATGADIDEASSGDEALMKLIETSYDLILMDVQMPVMDGLTATRQIRQWEIQQDQAHVPIVALTAHAFQSDIESALQAGCNLHIGKPVRKQRLLDAMDKLLESPSARGVNRVQAPYSLQIGRASVRTPVTL